MAYVPESDAWSEGIYQLEVTDPVQGGVDGVDNQQAKDLANRTVWLRNMIAGLAAETTLVVVNRTSTADWTAPVGVTQVIILEAVAPGGGGAGAWKNGAGSITIPGGGGGEGARVHGLVLTVTPETTYSVAVGAAGAGGTSRQNDTFDSSLLGADGGNITFGALLTVGGGKGGGVDTPATMSNHLTGISKGGDGGTCTYDGQTYYGRRGHHASFDQWGGDGGGFGGGRGGMDGGSMPGATAGTNGGGGGGAAKTTENGQSGGAGRIRFCYLQPVLTGQPAAV